MGRHNSGTTEMMVVATTKLVPVKVFILSEELIMLMPEAEV
jgi:hypothetical protein